MWQRAVPAAWAFEVPAEGLADAEEPEDGEGLDGADVEGAALLVDALAPAEPLGVTDRLGVDAPLFPIPPESVLEL